MRLQHLSFSPTREQELMGGLAERAYIDKQEVKLYTSPVNWNCIIIVKYATPQGELGIVVYRRGHEPCR